MKKNLLEMLNGQRRYFKNPPWNFNGTKKELNFFRMDVIKTYLYLRKVRARQILIK